MKILVSVLIMVFAGFGAATAQQNADNENEKFAEVKIKTSSKCNMCKERIETGLALAKGVKEVELDLEKNTVTVKYRKDKTDEDRIRKALTKIGYDADDMPADQKAHDRLPLCCQKDAEPH
ncbi:MAG: heavy-metal-associated domain-containing protein [Bacteroidales bacterium]|nr:heavy-metal-associated domain-containing protein [Bacteroidales bacterium]